LITRSLYIIKILANELARAAWGAAEMQKENPDFETREKMKK
jgi:hypothetical protein